MLVFPDLFTNCPAEFLNGVWSCYLLDKGLALEDKYSFWNFSGVSGCREEAAARTCSDRLWADAGLVVVGGKNRGNRGLGGKECRPGVGGGGDACEGEFVRARVASYAGVSADLEDS